MQINEKTHARMPPKLRAMFEKMPNPGSDEVVRLFPETGPSKSGGNSGSTAIWNDEGSAAIVDRGGHDDNGGSAARFFYVAKESQREIQRAEDFPLWGESHEAVKNTHATVKPLALMTYLVKLVTMPERNLILDPFAGSGSTLVACKLAGIPAVGIELDKEYCEIIANRLSQTKKELL